MTLPSTAAAGSIIKVLAGNSGNTFQIAQNSGQLIYYGAQNGVSQVTTTGTGGSLQSVDPNTTVTVICIVANTTWQVLDNVNSLIGILSQLPFEKVSGYIQSIRGQSIAQLQAAQASTLTDTPTE